MFQLMLARLFIFLVLLKGFHDPRYSLSINQFPISVILSNLYFQGGVGEDWEQVDPWQDGGFGAGIGSQDRLGDGDRRWRVSLCRGEYCRRCSSLRLLANPK